MNDRLDEFSIDESAHESEAEKFSEVELSITPLGDEFSRDVAPIKAGIDIVKEATMRIRQIIEDATLATASDLEEKLGAELRLLVETTNTKAKQTKDLLMQLKEKNARLRANGFNPAQLRIRENFRKKFMRSFIDEMKVYQNVQLEYKNGLRRKLKRQVKILKPTATPQEIDSIVDGDHQEEGGRELLFTQHFLGVADPIRSTYDKAVNKHRDIVALERSVAELHQMFQDLAVLTAEQGELLDEIELGVEHAIENVDKGNSHMEHAIVHQKEIRNKQCWIIVIVVFVIVILLIFLRAFRNLF